MLELIQSGGWLMVPIIGCSVMALAISIERFWSLATRRVAPRHLLAQTWAAVKRNELDPKRLKELRGGSPLGEILAAGITYTKSGRDATKEAMQDAAGQVLADLERYLSALGIIASIAPLLGLMGTVIGMIQMFGSLVNHGAGQTEMLAGGIAQALVSTAGGLAVAIPAVVVHRMLIRRVDLLMLTLEHEANRLLELLHGARDADRDAIWETVRDALRESVRDGVRDSVRSAIQEPQDSALKEIPN